MIIDDVDNFLEHFGIRGMRWGVRTKSTRSGDSGGTPAGKPKLEPKEEKPPKPPKPLSERKVKKNREKLLAKHRTISDEDLKKTIERLTNEKKLVDLLQEDLSPHRKKARKLTNEILTESGTKLAKNVVLGTSSGLVVRGLERHRKSSRAAEFITPFLKPKK